MKKIFLFLMIGILLFSTVSAVETCWGTYKQSDSIKIIQTCSTCTFNNVTSIILGNKTVIDLNEEMTKDGSVYNFTLLSNYTDSLGLYFVNGLGDLDGSNEIWQCDFEVTPSGITDNLGFFALIFAIVYLIGFFGFFGKHEWVSALGGMSMLSLSLYIITQGIVIYRDWFTLTISYVTLGLGALFVLIPLIEFLQNTF